MQSQKDAPLPNYPTFQQVTVYTCVIFIKQETTNLRLQNMKPWIRGFKVSTINCTEFLIKKHNFRSSTLDKNQSQHNGYVYTYN